MVSKIIGRSCLSIAAAMLLSANISYVQSAGGGEAPVVEAPAPGALVALSPVSAFPVKTSWLAESLVSVSKKDPAEVNAALEKVVGKVDKVNIPSDKIDDLTEALRAELRLEEKALDVFAQGLKERFDAGAKLGSKAARLGVKREDLGVFAYEQLQQQKTDLEGRLTAAQATLEEKQAALTKVQSGEAIDAKKTEIATLLGGSGLTFTDFDADNFEVKAKAIRDEAEALKTKCADADAEGITATLAAMAGGTELPESWGDSVAQYVNVVFNGAGDGSFIGDAKKNGVGLSKLKRKVDIIKALQGSIAAAHAKTSMLKANGVALKQAYGELKVLTDNSAGAVAAAQGEVDNAQRGVDDLTNALMGIGSKIKGSKEAFDGLSLAKVKAGEFKTQFDTAAEALKTEKERAEDELNKAREGAQKLEEQIKFLKEEKETLTQTQQDELQQKEQDLVVARGSVAQKQRDLDALTQKSLADQQRLRKQVSGYEAQSNALVGSSKKMLATFDGLFQNIQSGNMQGLQSQLSSVQRSVREGASSLIEMGYLDEDLYAWLRSSEDVISQPQQSLPILSPKNFKEEEDLTKNFDTQQLGQWSAPEDNDKKKMEAVTELEDENEDKDEDINITNYTFTDKKI